MLHDWHAHSTHSDGELDVGALLARVAAAGIDVFSLTDHDTVAGAHAAHTLGSALGVRVVYGAEISTRHHFIAGYTKARTYGIHVLAYGASACFLGYLDEALSGMAQKRLDRACAITERLDRHFHLNGKLGEQLPKTGSVGRPHIARAMVNLGLVGSVSDAFDRYLADGKAFFMPIDVLDLADTIALIKQCGGVSVLAHPTRYRLSATGTRRLIADFARLGGDGCELPAPNEPLGTQKMVDNAIMAANLYASVGSDFHGSFMPWRVLGRVRDFGLHKPIFYHQRLQDLGLAP